MYLIITELAQLLSQFFLSMIQIIFRNMIKSIINFFLNGTWRTLSTLLAPLPCKTGYPGYPGYLGGGGSVWGLRNIRW